MPGHISLLKVVQKFCHFQFNQFSHHVSKKIMPPVNLLSLSAAEKKTFLDSFDTIVTDCDGVIWNPKGVIHEANQAVEILGKMGKTIYYVTNNSTKTKKQLANKFEKHGFVNVTEDFIISTAGLAANYLRENLAPGKTVYLVGPPSVSEELAKYNIPCYGHGKDELSLDVFENISARGIEMPENVGAVLVAFDIHISYAKILKACTYLKNEQCLFVASNADETFPSASEYVVPGAGAILAPIRFVSGREPFILGKPSPYLGEILKRKVNAQRTLFVGDRLNTDILMGNRCSFKTLLVLTGIHGLDDVAKCEKSEDADERMSVPDYYTNTFSDLICE